MYLLADETNMAELLLAILLAYFLAFSLLYLARLEAKKLKYYISNEKGLCF